MNSARNIDGNVITGAASGSAIFIFATLIVLILNYVFNIALGWLLPPEGYGIYGVCAAIFTILSFFVLFGLPASVVKFLAEEAESKQKRSLVFRSSLLGNFLVALLVSGLFYIVYSQFLSLEKVYIPLIPIILGTTLIFSFAAINISALVGFFRFKERGAAVVLEAMLRLLVGIGLVYLGYGVFGALIGYLAGGLLAVLISVFFLRDFKWWEGEGWLDVRVFAFAVPVLLALMAITFIRSMDILAVKFLTEAAVSHELAGYYQATLVLARFPTYIAGAMAMAIFPFISRFGEDSIPTYAFRSIKYTLLFIFPISLAMAFMPQGFIKLFFPAPYLEGAQALAILALGMGFLSISFTLTRVFQALGKPKIPAVSLLSSVALQLVLLFVLIPRFGIVGAAISTTTACFVGMAVLAYVYWKMFKPELVSRRILSLLVSLAILGIIASLMPTPNRLMIVLTIIVAALGYLMMLVLLRLFTEKDLEILFRALPQGRWTNQLRSLSKKVVLKLNNLFQ